jgi:ribosomal protein S18 acetylase RimI-like enzyme
VRIVPFDTDRADHRDAFSALNLAWIQKLFDVEELDRQQLFHPESSILAHGGTILMAEETQDTTPTSAQDAAGLSSRILGTCALIAEPDNAFELAKMAVSEEARGLGIGRMLCEAAIAEARRRGASRVELLSNRSLTPAISLYRSLGFVEAPLPPTDYARADIKMVLELPDRGSA